MLDRGLTSSITCSSQKEQETECISVRVPKAINTKTFSSGEQILLKFRAVPPSSDQTYSLLSQRATHLS